MAQPTLSSEPNPHSPVPNILHETQHVPPPPLEHPQRLENPARRRPLPRHLRKVLELAPEREPLEVGALRAQVLARVDLGDVADYVDSVGVLDECARHAGFLGLGFEGGRGGRAGVADGQEL